MWYPLLYESLPMCDVVPVRPVTSNGDVPRWDVDLVSSCCVTQTWRCCGEAGEGLVVQW